MRDFDQQIASLSPEQQEKLLHLLRAKKEGVEHVSIPRLERKTDAFMTSFAQQRLWFLDQLEPATPYYNICRAFFLNGPLKIAAFERSLNALVNRHEAFRTSFAMKNEELMQIILPTASLPLVVEQLEGASVADIIQRVRTEALKPFDLQHGPLIRITLLQLHTEEYVFILTMHHIITDGWSLEIFFRELSLIYPTGQSALLPALPVQYADYAHWQREWLQGARFEEQKAYWFQQLRGMPERLALPTDRPRPALQTFRGALSPFAIPESISTSLKELSKREGVTLFMTLLAAFDILLYHYSGSQNLVVGSSVANRNRVEIEGLIGFFVNTLVLCVPLLPSLGFRSFLKQIQKITADAYEHQEFPFDRLVELLRPKRNQSYAPLVQVLFEMQNTPETMLNLADMSARPLEFERGLATFDLTLTFVDTGESLLGKLEYNTDLFDTLTITRMIEHLQVLLEHIVEHPEGIISDLPQVKAAYVPGYKLATIPSLPQAPEGIEKQRVIPQSSAFSAAQHALEQTIQSIWQEVLQRETVGLFDNFFDLGGHSFLILQVHRKLSEHLRLTFPVVDLFTYPTIGALSEHLASQKPQIQTTVLNGKQSASIRKEAMQRHQKKRLPAQPIRREGEFDHE